MACLKYCGISKNYFGVFTKNKKQNLELPLPCLRLGISCHLLKTKLRTEQRHGFKCFCELHIFEK